MLTPSSTLRVVLGYLQKEQQVFEHWSESIAACTLGSTKLYKSCKQRASAGEDASSRVGVGSLHPNRFSRMNLTSCKVLETHFALIPAGCAKLTSRTVLHCPISLCKEVKFWRHNRQ